MDATAKRLAKLTDICLALPNAESFPYGQQHRGFAVGKKKFAYYLSDHHGDGRIGLCCKAGPGEQEALIGSDPEKFYSPAYLGANGWIGIRLDLGPVDWVEIEELVTESYRLLAPKRLVARLGLPD
ncbi:MAG TPA: MmcQ/YjbR family DNA-binding protein [Pseudonocardiaceae bacterium]|nr:MmcQ/YjbR family DNA-binding protein [Pseudonocardiaceae bacterium]